MTRKQVFIAFALIYLGILIGGCTTSKSIGSEKYSPSPAIIVVKYPGGMDRVEGSVEIQGSCVRFQTIINGKSEMRIICGSFVISGYEANDQNLLKINKQIKCNTK